MTTPGKSKAPPAVIAPLDNIGPDRWRKAAGKKPCKNCPHWFKPREKGGSEQLFCSEDCRKEFHRNGAAFGKLREQLPKMIAKEVLRNAPAIVEQLRAEMRAQIADTLRHDFDYIERKEIGAAGIRVIARAVERFNLPAPHSRKIQNCPECGALYRGATHCAFCSKDRPADLAVKLI